MEQEEIKKLCEERVTSYYKGIQRGEIMERLTEKERNFDGSAVAKEEIAEFDGFLTPFGEKIITKLADYEDMDECGMVIHDENNVQAIRKMVDDKIEDCRKDILKRYLLYDLETAELHAFDQGYDKAIDDFVAMLSRYAFSNEYGTHIVFTPEQLDGMVARWKAGEK